MNKLIHPKVLISDNILYCCNWEYNDSKHYVYLTKDKLYEYIYRKEEKSYQYSLYLVKDFGDITANPMSYRPPNCGNDGYITICGRYETRTILVSFQFPCSEEGAKIAEELFVAISKVMN